MSELGIYFGPKALSIVETKANKPITQVNIPITAIKGAEVTEEKVPEEIKLAALIKDELAKNKITAKDVTVCLSGKDLIIRTFDMPVLPPREMVSVVNFESKKYIPFKLEEVISDAQWILDKAINKNRVLYACIKKEILEKYISVLNEVGLKVDAIECAAFSVVRFLKLANITAKGVSAMVSFDLFEEDEVNFIVLENGFPLFSRDITLAGVYTPEAQKSEESRLGLVLDKLKREIRISLDYYNRKFTAKKIEKMYFISAQDSRQDLESFTKEIGLPAQFIETARYFAGISPGLSLIKGYAAALSRRIKISVSIDLFAAKIKVASLKEGGFKRQLLALQLPSGINVEPKILIAGLLVCIAAFGFGFSKVKKAGGELKEIAKLQTQVAADKAKFSYEELTSLDLRYKGRIQAAANLKKQQLYLTELLDTLPRIIPENIWLIGLSFDLGPGDKPELRLQGIAYTGENGKESELVNAFRGKLAGNPVFSKYFKEINIASLDRRQDMKKDKAVTSFSILCRK